ncbi:MAG: ATP-grasp domain-containing protein [Desulfitobacterium hafniense]|nr:ATP-grasp domain-containing protein [Desulfitobacterium hafniense]
MRILIYEFFAAGARDDKQDLLPLGFSMLNALLTDFAQVPGLEIFTVLHPSLSKIVAQAQYSERVHIAWNREAEKNWLNQLEENLELCDGALLIAPETDGILAKLISLAEKKGKQIFGSNSQAVALVSNKADTLRLLKNRGLPVPKTEVWTWPLPPQWTERMLERFNTPLVLKPVYGAGGQGVIVVKEQAQLDESLKQLEEELNGAPFLVQDFVEGEAVSVSCLAAEGKVLPLSLNRQLIQQGEQLLFQGVTIPYRHPQAQEAFDVARQACELIEGLRGFVGVDLVLSPSGPVIMEINSRITVAYVALREVINRNLAHDLWLTCMERCLPTPPELNGEFTYRADLQQGV